jgi:protein-L-isoaspartate(D-aspartate) O-methyltransferase
MHSELFLFCFLAAVCVSCSHARDEEDAFGEARRRMVDVLRTQYGIKDPGVISAMAKVRRHVYIPSPTDPATAYGDHPFPIGHGQTISQPFIVAHMTECVAVKPGEKVLEIGTGSGYQAAVLAELGADVFSIEIVPGLAEHARRVLKSEGYNRVHVLTGDGYKGWPEHRPFDVIVVTCAPEDIPGALVQQLAEGGRMIAPVGSGFQRLVTLTKKGGSIAREDGLAVRFVPMVGEREKAESSK